MTHWHTYLFHDSVSPSMRDTLFVKAKDACQEYAHAKSLELSPQKQEQLTRWYFSQEGQTSLIAWFDAIWTVLNSHAEDAMPAHDARHALFKVPATAIEYIYAENVLSYERIGVFGALLHDYGRWAEERVMRGPSDSALHARLSTLLSAELLRKLEAPAEFKSLILGAVHQHTKGATPLDCMPTKLTVTADRDQLYGAEIVLRLFHHVAQEESMRSVFGADKNDKHPVMDRLFNFAINRLPGPLFSRQSHVNTLQEDLINFILLSENPTNSKKRFEKVSEFRPGTPFHWESAYELAHKDKRLGADPYVELNQMLSASNVAANPTYKRNALRKLINLTDSELSQLGSALSFINEKRHVQDARQSSALLCHQTQATEESDWILAVICNKLVGSGAYMQQMH